MLFINTVFLYTHFRIYHNLLPYHNFHAMETNNSSFRTNLKILSFFDDRDLTRKNRPLYRSLNALRETDAKIRISCILASRLKLIKAVLRSNRVSTIGSDE